MRSPSYRPWLKPLVPWWFGSALYWLIIVTVLGGLGYLVYVNVQADRACEARGGVRVRGYCIKRTEP